MNQNIRKFFSYKPPQPNVAEVLRLRPFIENYPNEDLIPQLLIVEEKYHYYRAINGDGNCFYRAMIFLYLKESDLSNFNKLFEKVEMICRLFPIQFVEPSFYQMLHILWENYLLPIAKYPPQRKEKQLENYFNTSWGFDALLVAYFRVINHNYIQRNPKKFAEFTGKDIIEELKKVLTFFQESQGIQIYALAEYLNIKVTITMALQGTVQQVSYMQKGRFNFRLFYRPGHYDILIQQAAEQARLSQKSLIMSASSNFDRHKSNIETSRIRQRQQSNNREEIDSPILENKPNSKINISQWKMSKKTEDKTLPESKNYFDKLFKIKQPSIVANRQIQNQNLNTNNSRSSFKEIEEKSERIQVKSGIRQKLQSPLDEKKSKWRIGFEIVTMLIVLAIIYKAIISK